MGLTAPIKRPTAGTALEMECLADGRVHVLGKHNPITIGGLPDNQIQVCNDPHVSRHHAKLWFDADLWLVADQKSTNGTLVNGAFVLQAKLNPGDLLQVGKTMFLVREKRKSIAVPGLPGVIAESQVMQPVKRAVHLYANYDEPLLITGERGTGKTELAKAIHEISDRAKHPFVELSGALSLSPNLLCSALFGHVRGAFTDAKTSREGLFEIAHGGTVFIDEIGDMDHTLQGNLLTVLETKKVQKVGSVEYFNSDFRFICATNQPMNSIRPELLDRLKCHIHIPPLRERPEDIPALARRFGGPLTSQEMRALKAHKWPGNVRELKTYLEIPKFLRPPLKESLIDLSPEEKARQLKKALKRNNGCYTSAAKDLGVHRATLYNWRRYL